MRRQKLDGGGWFDLDAAVLVCGESTRFDGHNHVSEATGSQWNHEAIYRTAGGAYIRNAWSQWQGSRETWERITRQGAARWILSYGDGDLPAELAEFAAEGQVQ